jgi:hypothetical protein
VVKKQDGDLGLQVANPRAAGIDIGNEQHYVAVPPQLTTRCAALAVSPPS